MSEETEDAKDTNTERRVRYKYCVVPECKSTTFRTPRKLFFSIPPGAARERWCDAMGRRAPLHKPLSAKCNRFCCEDHFDLENDMANYIRWKLMGKDTKKLMLKKGVIPHKFDCQSEAAAMKEKIRNQILATIQQNEMEMPLEKRSKKKRQTRVNTKKKKPADEKKQQETRKEEKSEEEKILEQRKKIERISNTKQATEVNSLESETYTFEIKVEAEDYYELNDGDSIIEEFLSEESHSSAPHNSRLVDVVDVKIEKLDEDNSHLVDVSDVKIEKLNEKLESEVVEEKTQVNIVEDEPNVTVTT